jgi:small subunit ribosomal protein S4e
MITGGCNTGRVGTVAHLEKHKGSFTIAHVKGAIGNALSTRAENVFIIGHPAKRLMSIP